MQFSSDTLQRTVGPAEEMGHDLVHLPVHSGCVTCCRRLGNSVAPPPLVSQADPSHAVAGWTGASLAIGNESMIRDLGCSTELAALGLAAQVHSWRVPPPLLTLLHRFPLGFGLAPLVLAPFSEAYGRYPMYVGSSIFFLVFFIPTAVAKNVGQSSQSSIVGPKLMLLLYSDHNCHSVKIDGRAGGVHWVHARGRDHRGFVHGGRSRTTQ